LRPQVSWHLSSHHSYNKLPCLPKGR
jgi:hypothetical protein